MTTTKDTMTAIRSMLIKEKDLAYLDWLFPLKYGISNRDEVIKTAQYKRRLDYEAYIVGHEAATNRLIGIVERAVEMADRIIERSSDHKKMNGMAESIAREFLSKLAETAEGLETLRGFGGDK